MNKVYKPLLSPAGPLAVSTDRWDMPDNTSGLSPHPQPIELLQHALQGFLRTHQTRNFLQTH